MLTKQRAQGARQTLVYIHSEQLYYHPEAHALSNRVGLYTENLSVIHAFDGESFERWYINQEPRKRRLSDAHELVS
uniref:Uncharacterized protein n=1 Tax=Zea mays TaxID=4577 RepID=A0A804MEI1_MAIZE